MMVVLSQMRCEVVASQHLWKRELTPNTYKHSVRMCVDILDILMFTYLIKAHFQLKTRYILDPI